MKRLKHRGSTLTITDMFCGAGGSSLGADSAGMEIVYALNHWQLAIRTHNTNFPDTEHICADVSMTDPRAIQRTDILWASPECTNHSIAKGKKRPRAQYGLFEGKRQLDPAADRSRATMWDVPRYAEIHDYEMVVVENVVDARAWLPWDGWIMAMQCLGYEHQVVYLNSMFAHLDPAGVREVVQFAPQSRDRLYVVFHKKGNPKPDLELRPKAFCPRCEREVEAIQTWKNTKKVRQFGGRWGRYGVQYLYTCKDCLYAIHRRHGRSLSNHHLAEAEVVPYHFAAWNAIDWSIPAERIGDRNKPLKPRTLERIRRGLEKYGNQHMVIDTAFSHRGGDKSRSMMEAMPTQTTGQTMGLLTPFIFNLLHGDASRPVDEAAPTQTARQSLGLVTPFVVQLRNNMDAQSMGEPLTTITAGGQHHGVLVPPPFLMSYYGNDVLRSTGEAMGTLTGIDRHALVMPFLVATGGVQARRLDAYGLGEEMPTLTGSSSLALALHIEGEQGEVMPAIEVDDCGFRMLQPAEIGRGMAFRADYHVEGNNREQVRQYGNAVTPPAASLLLARCAETFQ